MLPDENIFFIAIEATVPSRSDRYKGPAFSRLLQQLGDDCYSLNCVWCLKTRHSINEVYGFLRNDVIDPSDKFILAPMGGRWLHQNSMSDDDCFE